MAEIPIRSYLHEIEKHIESGRTDQAIAHCRHILQSYPKYVDAYRLLGKAYLESQRYGDAGDIFQRVLSSVPDDFVSHVGMSIIREDEGNLDEAIWHMERGFEVQPSNNAIQEELRRLYGKRDHVEPPKIRLTRGALARMYYKGELYQQAIGEIRATLADSPDRLDLKALLADIYLKINQRVEAADAALAVLHRLPNCLITIRVMIQVLSSTEREMEQKSYRQRLAQLDPYSVFAAIDASSSDAVSEHAIKLEKLDWKPDTSLDGEAGQPAWAASLGVDLGDLSPAKEDTLPDWLSGISTEPGASKEAEAIHSSAFTFDEAAPAAGGEESLIPASSEEEIPDWLRQAGWGPSTGAGELEEAQQSAAVQPEADQTESLPLVETEAAAALGDDHLAEADIPDWLKAMAPAPGTEDKAPEKVDEQVAEEEDVTPWLEKIIPTGSQAASPAPVEKEIPTLEPEEIPAAAAQVVAAAAAAELPDWLQGAGPVAEEATPVQAEPAASLPDWLTGAQESTAIPESSGVIEAEPTGTEAELPDWFSAGDDVTAPETLDMWSEKENASPESASVQELATELPDWLQKGEAVPEQELTGEPTWEEAASAEAEPAGEIPDWLLEVQAASPEGEIETPVAEAPATVEEERGLLDWLMEAAPSEAEMVPLEAEPASYEPTSAAEPAAGLPDWLMDVTLPEAEAFPTETEPTAIEPTYAVEPATELPDWLTNVAAIDEGIAPVASELEETASKDAEPASELPAWLFEAEEPAAGIADKELQAEPPDAETAGAIAAGEMAGWLSEAVPAEEETSFIDAEPATKMPAWLFETQEPVSQATGEEPGQEFVAGLPDWLKESEPTTQEPASLEAAPAEEMPAWLFETDDVKAMLEESPPQVVSETQLGDTQPLRLKQAQPSESAGQPEAISPDNLELDDAFAWLLGVGATEAVQPAQEQPVPETVAIIPEIPLIEGQPESGIPVEIIQEEPATAELLVEQVVPEPPVTESELDADTAFAWLESLAVKQGANEALILKPEERLESMPEWVRQDALAAEQALPETPAEELETPAPEAEIPVPKVELAPEPLAEIEPVEQPMPAPVESEPPRPGGVTDDDSAFAWLESLAVKQGANEALILKPEERLETMPDWVRQDALTLEQATPEALPVEAEAPEAGLEEPLQVAGLETEPVAEEELLSETQVTVEQQPAIEQPAVYEELPVDLAEPEAELSLLAEELPIMAETGPSGPQPELAEAPVAQPEPEPSLLAEELPIMVETEPSEPQPELAEAPVAPTEPEPAPVKRGTAGLPELPDWLTESVISPREEMEWTPPPVPQRRYDLNQASLSELERLPGVGFIAAQQITGYRDAHGPFSQIDDLKNIPGISSSLVRGIRDYLFVAEPQEPSHVSPETVIQLGGPVESGLAPELIDARAQLTGGEMPQALEKYAVLIRSNSNLESVIQDLQAAAYRFPTDINVWQHLGDACLRVDRVQDALQAFIKAEQLLN